MSVSTELSFDLRGIDFRVSVKLDERDAAYVTRYALLAEMIEDYQVQVGKQPRVLDVGGFGGALDAFIGIEYTIIDVFDSNENNYIKGSALDMPFKDDSFDIVISSDVFEHIKSEDREQFLKECLRVSSDLVLLCAPFNTTGVAKAEDRVNGYYHALTGEDYTWLKEHREFGLPQLNPTIDLLNKYAKEVINFSHFSLDVWEEIMKLSFFTSFAEGVNKDSRKFREAVNKQYLETLAATDFNATGYRQFVVATKKSKLKITLPKANSTSHEAAKMAVAAEFGKAAKSAVLSIIRAGANHEKLRTENRILSRKVRSLQDQNRDLLAQNQQLVNRIGRVTRLLPVKIVLKVLRPLMKRSERKK